MANLNLLSTRRLLTFLLLSVSAATWLLSFASASGDESASRSSSSRREAGDETYIGRDHRGDAISVLCDNAQQGFWDHISGDIDRGDGPWKEGEASVILANIHTKPVLTPEYSLCPTLPTTCCNMEAEKVIENLVQTEFRFHYHNVIQDTYFKFCSSPGKELYHGMRENFVEIKRQLDIEANYSSNMELPDDTFDELFIYLSNFLVQPDICQLPLIVTSQVDRIVETLVMGFLDGDESVFGNTTSPDDRKLCIMNATKSFTQTDTSILINFLGHLLYDYRELVESVYLTEKVIRKIQLHTSSPSCISAIARMRYCSKCGGYAYHAPCLNLCINTFRGCLADVADVHKEVAVLLKLLREHAVDILPDLKPGAMREGLSNFITLIGNIVTKKRKVIAAVATSCGGSPSDYRYDDDGDDEMDEDETLRGRKKRQVHYQPINPISEQEEASRVLDIPADSRLGNFDPLSEAFTVELRCLDLFEEGIRDVPENLCFHGRAKYSEAINVKCWTGTELLIKDERYEETLVGPYKSDQKNNTAFEHHKIEPGSLYSDHISRLQQGIEKLNKTLTENKRCSESDDEDQCARDLFQHCVYSTPKPPDCEDGECGSGFGSGSGSGSGFGFQDDTESTPTDRSSDEYTTSNGNRNGQSDEANRNRYNNKYDNRFNDAPAGPTVESTETDVRSTTENYARGTVGVINIDPDKGDEEEEEEAEADVTPTRSRVKPTQSVGDVEEVKDIGNTSDSLELRFSFVVTFLALLSVFAGFME